MYFEFVQPNFEGIETVPIQFHVFSFYYWCHRLHLYILCAPKHRFIIFLVNLSCNSCQKLKIELQNKISIILAFIIAHVWKSLFLYTALSYWLLPFHFNLTLFIYHFVRSRSSGNKLPQLLLIWECLNFSLICKDSFASEFIFFQHFVYINPLPSVL